MRAMKAASSACLFVAKASWLVEEWASFSLLLDFFAPGARLFLAAPASAPAESPAPFLSAAAASYAASSSSCRILSLVAL